MSSNILKFENPKIISPNDMDSFDNDTIRTNNSTNGGGGSGMDKYVTKDELKSTEALLSEKIDHRADVTDSKLSSVNWKLNWIFGIIASVAAAIILKLFI